MQGRHKQNAFDNNYQNTIVGNDINDIDDTIVGKLVHFNIETCS